MITKKRKRTRATPPCGKDWELADGKLVEKATPWVRTSDKTDDTPAPRHLGRIVYGPEGSGWWEYEQ